jgi:putative transposase
MIARTVRTDEELMLAYVGGDRRRLQRARRTLPNEVRPHQALGMKSPASCYRPSARPYRGLPELEYPFHDKTVIVTRCGRICLQRKKVNLSTVFAGQKVGIKQVDEKLWLASFMSHDLGYLDEDACRLEPIENPFAAKVLPGALQ